MTNPPKASVRTGSSARGIPAAEPLRGARSVAPLVPGNPDAAPRGVGLSSPADGTMDALRALESALGPERFWGPGGLGQVPTDAAEAYSRRVIQEAAADPNSRVTAEEWLSTAEVLRQANCMDRFPSLWKLLRTEFPNADLWTLDRERAEHAMAYRCGVPWAMIFMDHDIVSNLRMSAKATWLPDGYTAWRNLDLMGTEVENLPLGLVVPGRLDIGGTRIREIPAGTKVGDLEASAGMLEVLPEGLSCNILRVARTPLRELPKGLQVALSLVIQETRVASLPRDLEVGSSIWIQGTPLAARSDEEIRAMAPRLSPEVRIIR